MDSLLHILLLVAFATSFSYCSSESSRKELRDKEVNEQHPLLLGHSFQSNRIDPTRVMQLSWRPRLFLYSGLLSDEECDNLISSTVKVKNTEIRNDSENVGTGRQLAGLESGLNIAHNIVARIEEKLSAWTFLPQENGEPLQVLHYGLEKAEQKLDYFGNESRRESSKPLTAMVIIYLSNISRGGDIFFPGLEAKNLIRSDCSETSNALRPTKGNAILLFTRHLNGSLDNLSSHGRCPILEGEMWCATKFFHVRAVKKDNISSETDGNDCTDEDENCSHWAALGECEKNPVYMIGSPDYYGTCRKSCNAC